MRERACWTESWGSRSLCPEDSMESSSKPAGDLYWNLGTVQQPRCQSGKKAARKRWLQKSKRIHSDEGSDHFCRREASWRAAFPRHQAARRLQQVSCLPRGPPSALDGSAHGFLYTKTYSSWPGSILLRTRDTAALEGQKDHPH